MDHSLPGSSVHQIFPGKNTGVGCHALLQGIFPTQELNLSLSTLQIGFFTIELSGKPQTNLYCLNITAISGDHIFLLQIQIKA